MRSKSVAQKLIAFCISKIICIFVYNTNVMKRLLLLFALLTSFAVKVYADEFWDSELLTMKYVPSEGMSVWNNNSNNVTFHNPNAQTKEDEKNNYIRHEQASMTRFVYRKNPSDPRKVITFKIEDINGEPGKYKYPVTNEKGKVKYIDNIYWGVRVFLIDKGGDWSNHVEITYHPKPSGYYGTTSHSWAVDYKVTGFNRRDGFSRAYDEGKTLTLGIEMFGNNQCRINLGSNKTEVINSVVGVARVEFLLYHGAKIRVYNGEIKTETLYGRVYPYIKSAQEKVKKEEYLQAATEFTKAINSGYRSYDIFKQRAEAYIGCQFYNNALEDCTNAIKCSPKAEMYLLRGKVKLQLGDPSCIEDFEFGGAEGKAIASELRGHIGSAVAAPNNGTQCRSTGSGFVITRSGVIATNYHVVEGAKRIEVLVSNGGVVSSYNAEVIISDKTNDLSLIQIKDSRFSQFPPIPYSVNTRVADVGTSVFALGYPMSDILGEEIKLTDGLISSKTGYQGDITTYQISAPIQPGNSGGPLFNKRGELVGITNAGVPDAQNVGYAIKTSYLQNLVAVAPVSVSLPSYNTISELAFTDKIKRLTPFVVLIKIY